MRISYSSSIIKATRRIQYVDKEKGDIFLSLELDETGPAYRAVVSGPAFRGAGSGTSLQDAINCAFRDAWLEVTPLDELARSFRTNFFKTGKDNVSSR